MTEVLLRFPRTTEGLGNAQDYMSDHPGTKVRIPWTGDEIFVEVDDRPPGVSAAEEEFAILCSTVMAVKAMGEPDSKED